MSRIPGWVVHGCILIAIVAPVLVILYLRTLDIYGAWNAVPFTVLASFLGWYGCFIGGYLAAGPLRPAGGGSLPDPNLWVPLLAMIAAVGAAIMTYHFAIVRGYGFGVPVYELRMRQIMEAEAGYVGTWLSGTGRLFLAAILAAWVVATVSWRRLRLRSLVVLVAASALVLAYQAVYEGGRIFVVGLVVAALFGCLLWFLSEATKDGRIELRRLELSHAVPVLILLAMLAGTSVYSSYIFAERGEYVAENLEDGGGEQTEASPDTKHKLDRVLDKLKAEGGDLMVPSPYALAYLNYAAVMDIDFSTFQDAATFTSADYVRAMAWSYVTQGVSEYARLYRVDPLTHAWGFYQFPQVAQVLSILAHVDLRYQLAEGVPNGTYITLPGAFYLDFGTTIGLAVAFATGLVFRRGVDRAMTARGGIAIFAAPVLFVLLMAAPVTTLVPTFWPCLAWIVAILMFDPLRAWFRRTPGRGLPS